MATAPPSFLHILIILTFLAIVSDSRLNYNYYKKSCPRFDQFMQDTITNKQITSPTTTAAVASSSTTASSTAATVRFSFPPPPSTKLNLTLTSTSPSPTKPLMSLCEPKPPLNLHVPTPSPAPTSSLSPPTRDLVTMVGGPYYNVLLGRKDGKISNAEYVEGNLPKPTMPMS